MPKLTDKRILEARAEEERLRREANKKEDPGFTYNDLSVFKKALGDAVHATRGEPQRTKYTIPDIRETPRNIGMNNDSRETSEMKSSVLNPRQVENLRPGSTRALPQHLVPNRRGLKSAALARNAPKTRYQMTQDRICQNI